MPQYITGKPQTVQILIENMLYAHNLARLKHDGSKTNSKMYTRKYELMLYGKPTGVELRFVYDNRIDIHTAEIEITGYDLLELKTQQLLKGIKNDRIQVYEAE